MVKTAFWPPSWTFDVMTYVTWQRQDDVTYAKMCLPSLLTDTMRWFSRLESSKKLQGKNARGWYPPPLGVRGLMNWIIPIMVSFLPRKFTDEWIRLFLSIRVEKIKLLNQDSEFYTLFELTLVCPSSSVTTIGWKSWNFSAKVVFILVAKFDWGGMPTYGVYSIFLVMNPLLPSPLWCVLELLTPLRPENEYSCQTCKGFMSISWRPSVIFNIFDIFEPFTAKLLVVHLRIVNPSMTWKWIFLTNLWRFHVDILKYVRMHSDIQTGRQTDRPAGQPADRPTDRQTDRQTDRKGDKDK